MRKRRHIPGYTHIGGDLYMDSDGIAVTFMPEFEDYGTHAYVGRPPGGDSSSDRPNSTDGRQQQQQQRRRRHAHSSARSEMRSEEERVLARLGMAERQDVLMHIGNLDLQSFPMSRAELKCAYNAAAKRYHPDVAKSGDADSGTFHKATLAYQHLLKVLVKLNLV